MRKTIILLSFFSFLMVNAQEADYRYADATQMWRLSNNAAGLSLDIDNAVDSSHYNRGYALFNLQHQEGSYHRVQEGNSKNSLGFQAERYQRIGRSLVGYGRFDFGMDHTKEKAWCDVMRPYDSNPYMSASSVYGTYDTQTFDFTGALGTVGLGNWRVGAKLDYKVADLSRLRDPRSRSQLLDYKITPAVTYTSDAHTLGLSASYNRRKEKIANIQTVQNDPNLSYYLLSGMENASGSVGAYKGFEREWVDHRFGGELTYAFRSGRQHTMVSLMMERGEEFVYGQYKYEPGRYTSFVYGGNIRSRLTTGNILHEINLGCQYAQGYADEYRQKLVQTKDQQTGLTSYSYETQLTYKKRYQVETLNAELRYRAHFTEDKKDNAYAGFHIQMDKSKNKHLLPVSSLKHSGTTMMAEGGMNIAKNLWVDAVAGGHISNEAALSLDDATTDYAVGVLIPDMQYYDANYWRGRLQLTYEFPLTIKGQLSRFFVRAYGDYLKTNNSLDAKCFGLSIGIFN